jgi:hypothetical protein
MDDLSKNEFLADFSKEPALKMLVSGGAVWVQTFV